MNEKNMNDLCQELFEEWAEDKDFPLDQLFASTSGVPENPYEDALTNVAYGGWLAAWKRFAEPMREILKAASTPSVDKTALLIGMEHIQHTAETAMKPGEDSEPCDTKPC